MWYETKSRLNPNIRYFSNLTIVITLCHILCITFVSSNFALLCMICVLLGLLLSSPPIPPCMINRRPCFLKKVSYQTISGVEYACYLYIIHRISYVLLEQYCNLLLIWKSGFWRFCMSKFIFLCRSRSSLRWVLFLLLPLQHHLLTTWSPMEWKLQP